ncbi:tRNA 2-thiouridine(34) synthase MnmA [Oceanithermus sp.]
MRGPLVLVGFSGGVDSSVAAALLQEQGYRVRGVMLDLWRESEGCQTDPENCPAAVAARVAEKLGIEFELRDWREEFRRRIVDDFTAAYARGLTPNPCVRCNSEIKFAALLRLAGEYGASFVASGHYVRRLAAGGEIELHRGEPRKDQTYFLWRLARQNLPRILFPLGELSKNEVRDMAARLGLASADRAESQNVCFIPGSLREFLAPRLETKPGPLVDLESGEVIGEHAGAAFYTVGQRKGLGLWKSHLERYVVEVRPQSNEVVVGPRRAVMHGGLEAGELNLLTENLPQEVEAVVRYRARPVRARILELDEKNGRLALAFAKPQFAVTPGQSVALYRGTRLLGGAVIERALTAQR